MDKYVLITNANNETGNAVAKKLIADNYIVFVGSSKFENKKFGNLIYVNLDTLNNKSMENAKRYIQTYTSRINSIINLTSYTAFAAMAECSVEEVLNSIEENFFRVFKANKIFWDLLEQRRGKIINDCSDLSAYEYAPFNGLNSLSKSLISNYSDVLRRELRYRGINVIRIHTGLVKDSGYDVLLNKYLQSSEESKYFHSEMSRFKDLNISKEQTITIDEYADFIAKVLKIKLPKRAYYYKCNKTLKRFSRRPKFLQELGFENYQK